MAVDGATADKADATAVAARVVERGFASTSRDVFLTGRFGNPVEILLPAGTRCLYVGSIIPDTAEEEILLAPGATFAFSKIVKVHFLDDFDDFLPQVRFLGYAPSRPSRRDCDSEKLAEELPEKLAEKLAGGHWSHSAARHLHGQKSPRPRPSPRPRSSSRKKQSSPRRLRR